MTKTRKITTNAAPKMSRAEVLAALAKAVMNGSLSPAGATDAINRYDAENAAY